MDGLFSRWLEGLFLCLRVTVTMDQTARIDVVEAVTGSSVAELTAARDGAVAELVELRLDYLDRVDADAVAGALAGRRRPVIVTCRAAWEGGQFNGSEDERLRILAEAIRLGAEYVDIEWKVEPRRRPSAGQSKIVLSSHDFERIPADLGTRVRAMAGQGADIVKVAVTPATLRDCIGIRDAVAIDTPHVAIAMGAAGQLTRLCPWLFGSCWTYGGAVAPGQVSARDMIARYRVPKGSQRTAVYGITGAPLGHSASPAMHNAAFDALGIDAIYVSFQTADADELLAVADAFGVTGLSVTAPLKPALFPHAVERDELSERIGVVNTLRRRADGWAARNFDASGFLAPLKRRGRSLEGARAVILGAGGTARTVAWALGREGARVEVSARRAERAAAVAAEFGATAVAWPPVSGWDLLVNTTPVGTWPAVDAAPVDRELVRGRMVYDLIYNPRETQLLAWARAAGAETIGGLEMLVGQACHQFEWWTGRPAPADVMADAAEAFLAELTATKTTGGQ